MLQLSSALLLLAAAGARARPAASEGMVAPPMPMPPNLPPSAPPPPSANTTISLYNVGIVRSPPGQVRLRGPGRPVPELFRTQTGSAATFPALARGRRLLQRQHRGAPLSPRPPAGDDNPGADAVADRADPGAQRPTMPAGHERRRLLGFAVVSGHRLHPGARRLLPLDRALAVDAGRCRTATRRSRREPRAVHAGPALVTPLDMLTPVTISRALPARPSRRARSTR